ncbi:KxYKxGKxW signal peptide domain-containing protein [Dellaglioa algida]|uniref:KxYKxGKxW signal domain protein n=1 Tax=Dellaglioa algida DSM 15638 TaxID=1423719 RepID=A0A0R1HG16_9LACO|nr:KxYKxGKxW signal peptide domain-containing protein [Dellaglioa algida]KRK45072.1 hypothetical protein FC66_GL000537 [Dellaglioa algida DSM 15638]MDK1719238.1 KxYKxGKxW signal peptide domain-containing protein [Dellaglioa algida]
MLRNNYFGETKTHYKLYKRGKNWAVMGISLFSLGLGMLVTGQPVSADVTATSTSSSAAKAETTSASSSSAAKAETTSAGGNQIVAQTATNVSKNDAIVTTKFAQNYDRRVLAGSVTNTGFSVSDPDYPSGMWIDPDKSHYSYEWLGSVAKF